VALVRVRIWDWPIRIFHWSLAAAIGFAWWTAETGRMQPHRWAGYAVLALLTFRLFWGVAGGDTARFASFVRGPRAALAYARGLFDRTRPPSIGHNPLGGWSVIALLATTTALVVLGLFAVDVDGIESGPLSTWVSFDVGRIAAQGHALVFNLLLGLVALHLAAVLFYLVVRRDNLIAPMLHGFRHAERDPGHRFASPARIALGVVLAAALAWLASRGFSL
jgi:cytochrome b